MWILCQPFDKPRACALKWSSFRHKYMGAIEVGTFRSKGLQQHVKIHPRCSRSFGMGPPQRLVAMTFCWRSATCAVQTESDVR